MNCSELTYEQAEKIKATLNPTLDYLNRLRRRMDKRGFPPSDPLLRAVIEAVDAMHELMVDLHYLSCDRMRGR